MLKTKLVAIPERPDVAVFIFKDRPFIRYINTKAKNKGIIMVLVRPDQESAVVANG